MGSSLRSVDLAGQLAGQERSDPRARWDELFAAYQRLATTVA